MALTNNGWSLIALPLLANRCKGGISERRKARTFLFSSSLSLLLSQILSMAFEPFSVVLAAFTASSRSTDIFLRMGVALSCRLGGHKSPST